MIAVRFVNVACECAVVELDEVGTGAEIGVVFDIEPQRVCSAFGRVKLSRNPYTHFCQNALVRGSRDFERSREGKIVGVEIDIDMHGKNSPTHGRIRAHLAHNEIVPGIDAVQTDVDLDADAALVLDDVATEVADAEILRIDVHLAEGLVLGRVAWLKIENVGIMPIDRRVTPERDDVVAHALGGHASDDLGAISADR